jgi:KDO2-lipid IV(A) lauroyltransferase
MAQGKGIVFLTGHCGNWELGALAFSHNINAPVAVVARRQNNPYLNAMVEKMRIQYQNRIIYKDNAMRSMLAVIRKNGIVGLLLDQAVFPEDGAKIPFLGRMAWASKVPVVLARKTGVVVLPVFTHREGERHVITINPPCTFAGSDSAEGMAEDVKHYSAYIERSIIAHPTDWYWVHRRWKRAGEVI